MLGYVDGSLHQTASSIERSAMLDLVVDLVEFRDGNTGGHIARTREYLQLLIQELLREHIYYDVVGDWNPALVADSSRLHDVGKIAICDRILNKPRKLSRDEFAEMKTHVLVGVTIIRRMERTIHAADFLRHAKVITMSHHEKWDGSGYPYRLCGERIPLEGRLMAIADVYDALTSSRPYKLPYSTSHAEHVIVQGRGRHFDPVLVDVFEEIAPKFAAIAEYYQHDSVDEPCRRVSNAGA
jgi:putative two-component system response regulator